MAFNRGPKIVTNGLVLALDAASKNSYPGTGTVWTDLSGNNNNGTLVNGPTFNSSNGSSIEFNATSQYVNLGTIFNYTSQPFTFSYWANFNSLTTNVGGQGPIVLYKGSYATNGYYDQIASDGTVTFITNQSGVIQVSNAIAGNIIIATWCNIAYTRNGASIRIYVNGIDKTAGAGTHINPVSSANNWPHHPLSIMDLDGS